jgi:long-chain acyl-CoA synthetase
MQMYMTQALHQAMQSHGDSTATVAGSVRRTWREFGGRVARFASALRELGIKPGDRVGMLAANSDRYLEYYMAVWWAGGVVNPVNTRWSPTEIAYSLDDCPTRILVVDHNFAGLVPEIQAKSKMLQSLVYAGDGAAPQGMLSYEDLIANHAAVSDAIRGDDDIAGVFYTGGTTGFPKGVMISHANLVSNAWSCMSELPLGLGAVVLHAAPLFHLAAVSLMTRAFVRASTHICLTRFDPALLLESLAAERVTNLLLVPVMVQMMVDHPDLKRHDLSKLKQIIYGASPISEAVLDRAFAALPGVELTQGYGMTELSAGVTCLVGHYHTAEGRGKGKLRSAGQALPGVDLSVVDSDDQPVAPKVVGEIVARGPGMMLGYWNKPEETQKALRGGWMHTGDAGYLDEDGFLFIVDRVKDMIVTGGENVYSAEVENALQKHADVQACAVIGIPDEKWGESILAVTVLRVGATATAEDLKAHCQSLIANYKCPRVFEFRTQLPMSAAGKLQKFELRAPYWQGRERNVG